MSPGVFAFPGLTQLVDADGAVRGVLGDEEDILLAEVVPGPQRSWNPPSSHAGWLLEGSAVARRVLIPLGVAFGRLSYALSRERVWTVRSLAVLVTIYGFLVIAFGYGIWLSAGRSRPLRVVGGLMVADGVFGFAWPPMHLREVLGAGGATLTDTMHLVFTAVTVLMMLLMIGFGAAAFGKRFRLYSIATLVTLVVFGVLTGLDGPRVAANLPTPSAGVWERINIGAYMLWVVVLAVALLRVPSSRVSLSAAPSGHR